MIHRGYANIRIRFKPELWGVRATQLLGTSRPVWTAGSVLPRQLSEPSLKRKKKAGAVGNLGGGAYPAWGPGFNTEHEGRL